MTQTNPWRLLIIVLAAVSYVGSVTFDLAGDPDPIVIPLRAASVGLGVLWLVVSAICWEIRRR